ncbi:hypothetical protein ABPG73_021868 [Tetrahymena malaccensis]
MKNTYIDLISLQAVYLLMAFNFQAVLSKELLISEEFQKPQITKIDVNGWSQNIIRTCEQKNINQCKSCIQNAELVDDICICSGSLFAYKFECVSVCPDGFTGNIKTKICEQSKCFNNCQDCINQSCTQCNIPYKLMNGECFLQCPSYSIDKGTYCEDKIIEFINGGYIFKGLFSSNFGDSEIQGKGLRLSEFKNGGATFSSCSGERYVGGWNVAGSGSQILFELKNIKPYRKVRIGFKYIMIDNWDQNEFIQVINNSKIICNITHESGKPVGNICGNKNQEVKGFYEYNSTLISQNFQFSIQNNLNPNKTSYEASFGIREMYILVDFCQEGCLECNETGCTRCSQGLYLFQHNCVENCPQDEGYWANQQTNTCDQCQDNCLTCDISVSSCLKCKQNTYFLDKKCLITCPDGYDSDKQTQECKKLDNPGIQCEDETYLFDNKCQSTCPDGYIPNQQTHKCDKTGIQCKDGTYLFDNKCSNTCPDGYIPNQQTNQCNKSDNPGTKCKDGTFLFDKKCQSTCPDQYAPNQASKECDKCHQSCKTCLYPNDENYCTSCTSNLFLNGSQCLEQCLDRTYQDKKTNKCEPCHSTCFSCTGKRNNQCQKCIRGYFFYKGECLKECPRSTYPKKI